MRSQRLILFIIAASGIVYGLLNKEYRSVMNKAATICLECIGIG